MNWDALSAIAESIGVVGVIVSLIYLAIQLKESTNVARSQSRQSISEFIQKFAEIRTTHADRMAKLQSSTDLQMQIGVSNVDTLPSFAARGNVSLPVSLRPYASIALAPIR